VDSQYQRLRTLKDVLHLLAECTGQSNVLHLPAECTGQSNVLHLPAECTGQSNVLHLPAECTGQSNVLHLPAECTGQSNSCTDRKIFKRWFFHMCGPSAKENFRKTGLPENGKFRPFLDNCTVHSREFELRSGNISVLYLPPNMTPLIQPMD